MIIIHTKQHQLNVLSLGKWNKRFLNDISALNKKYCSIVRNDANQKSADAKNIYANGLVTFSTPNIQQPGYLPGNYSSAFQSYRNLIQNYTPKTAEKVIRKPKVNFHSIDDIVNGGKSGKLSFLCVYFVLYSVTTYDAYVDDENNDSGYQSSTTKCSLLSITNVESPSNTNQYQSRCSVKGKIVENEANENGSDNEAENEGNDSSKVIGLFISNTDQNNYFFYSSLLKDQIEYK